MGQIWDYVQVNWSWNLNFELKVNCRMTLRSMGRFFQAMSNFWEVVNKSSWIRVTWRYILVLVIVNLCWKNAKKFPILLAQPLFTISQSVLHEKFQQNVSKFAILMTWENLQFFFKLKKLEVFLYQKMANFEEFPKVAHCLKKTTHATQLKNFKNVLTLKLWGVRNQYIILVQILLFPLLIYYVPEEY